MNKRPVRCAALLLGGAAGLLSACGGGGHDSQPVAVVPTPAPTAEVPATASLSVVGYLSYIADLLKSAADGLEPVALTSVTAPVDDASEPVSLAN